jgi:hypothetical protein
METITKTYKVYNFEELKPEIQEKVIQDLYDINTDYNGWHDSTIEDIKTIAGLIGIEIENIFYSGFSSQGDGACFEGRYEYNKTALQELKAYSPNEKEPIRIATALKELQRENKNELTATVKHSGYYYHENCTVINVFKNYEYEFNEETEEAVINLLKDFMRWIYKALQKDYDYLTSREAIIDTIKANDYTFLENGKIFNE